MLAIILASACSQPQLKLCSARNTRRPRVLSTQLKGANTRDAMRPRVLSAKLEIGNARETRRPHVSCAQLKVTIASDTIGVRLFSTSSLKSPMLAIL